jgi:hypothetical protein
VGPNCGSAPAANIFVQPGGLLQRGGGSQARSPLEVGGRERHHRGSQTNQRPPDGAVTALDFFRITVARVARQRDFALRMRRGRSARRGHASCVDVPQEVGEPPHHWAQRQVDRPGKYDVKVAPTNLPLGPVQQKAQADTGGSDGGTGTAYAFSERHHTDRHHPLAIAIGASKAIGFEWREAAGMAPPADLSLEVEGHVVVQVSSIAGRPFVRAGLDVAPLEPEAPYELVLLREEGLLSVSIENAAHHVVLTTQVAASDELQNVADVVVAGAPWSRSIASDRLE